MRAEESEWDEDRMAERMKIRGVPGIKVSMLYALLFVLLIISGIAYSANAPATPVAATGPESRCATDICDSPALALEVSNWRVLAVLALAVSALMISVMYMLGKAMADESLETRAKSEFVSLMITAVLVAIIILLVQFMCSSVVPSFLYGSGFVLSQTQQPTLLKTSCTYLEKMSDTCRNVFYRTFTVLFASNWGHTFVEDKMGRSFGEAAVMLINAIDALLDTMMAAYLVISAQIFLIKFVQPFALVYLLPAGIVLRSFIPFRRFGGALIGVAIGLFFFLPLLVTINAVIMDSQFPKLALEYENKCTLDYDCCSHVCKNGECQIKLGDGENCTLNTQCQSGICEDVGNDLRQCKPCLTDGERCAVSADCCKGFKCEPGEGAEKYCVLAKEDEEGCSDNMECMSRVCYNGNCSEPRAAGADCTDPIDCYSGKCMGGKCTECNMSATEFTTAISEGNMVRNAGGSVSKFSGAVSQALPLNPSVQITNYLVQKLIGMFNSVFEAVTVITIAGVVLPLLNLLLLTTAIRDLSGFFGAETDISIATIWGVIG